MHTSTRLVRLAVGAAALAIVFVAAPQAQAAVPRPGCDAASCLGKDPYTTLGNTGESCADSAYYVRDSNNATGYARATDHANFQGAQLVYSPFCNANWVEWVGGDCGGPGQWKVLQYDGTAEWPDGHGVNTLVSPWRTSMVDGSRVAEAAMYDVCDSTRSWYFSGWF
jgi:hypothetical protein